MVFHSCMFYFFFFKQKTAYEMRISDWSSDVCSSDLIGKNPDKKVGALNYGYSLVETMDYLLGVDGDTTPEPDAIEHLVDEIASDDRKIGRARVGKECVSTCRSRWAPYH